jgi:hypothetical protein
MAEKIGLKAFRTIGSRMGLRKAAARRLAEAGWTTPKIMAITGHKSLQVVERYLRETTQERSAPAAIRKLERRTGAKGSQNPSRVCKNSEKISQLDCDCRRRRTRQEGGRQQNSLAISGAFLAVQQRPDTTERNHL